MTAHELSQNITLVLGGAASGKSKWAEQWVTATGRKRVYLATSQALDEEMSAKIEAHRLQRGPDWRTIEEPLNISAALENVSADEAVLLDCATLWLSNLMFSEADIEAATAQLCDSLIACSAPITIVSNEIGLGLVPEHAISRRFRDAQGALNQRLAEISQTVVFIAAGLPLALKGSL